jgi:hypothetical protein
MRSAPQSPRDERGRRSNGPSNPHMKERRHYPLAVEGPLPARPQIDWRLGRALLTSRTLWCAPDGGSTPPDGIRRGGSVWVLAR